MSRILVFSDVHANLAALEAVLSDAGAVDGYWFLGDLVGYGPQPNECIERVRSLPNLLAVMGNHDAATVGQMPLGWFNDAAIAAIVWTQSRLSPENFLFLSQRPKIITQGDITLVHGSPREPIAEYVLTAETALSAIEASPTPFTFVGHTHRPGCWQALDGAIYHCAPPQTNSLTMPPKSLYNPGAVGQPRDGDPRASYALYFPEEKRWEWHRVQYDIASTQSLMRKFGLPERNAYRLAIGR